MPALKATSIWITPVELEQAKEKAAVRDLSLSQLVRKLLRELPAKNAKRS